MTNEPKPNLSAEAGQYIHVEDDTAVSSLRKAIEANQANHGSVFDMSLSELVTTDNIEYAVNAAHNTFANCQRVDRTLLSGQEVSVTEASAVENIDGETYYVRLKKYYEGEGRKRSLGGDTFVTLDRTATVDTIDLVAPRMMRAESGDDLPRGIYVAQPHDLTPALNDAGDLSFVKRTCLAISQANAELLQAQTAEAQRLQAEAQRKAEAQKREKAKRRKRIAGKIGDIAFTATVILTSVGVIGGVVYGASKIDFSGGPSRVETFDSAEYALEGPGIANIGQSTTPGYSEQLRFNPELAPDAIPEVGEIHDSPHYSSSNSSSSMTATEGAIMPAESLREIVITRAAEPNSVEVVQIELTGPDDYIEAWTDSLTPEDFSVSLDENGNVTVMRFSAEASKDDDVRVVIRHVPLGLDGQGQQAGNN